MKVQAAIHWSQMPFNYLYPPAKPGVGTLTVVPLQSTEALQLITEIQLSYKCLFPDTIRTDYISKPELRYNPWCTNEVYTDCLFTFTERITTHHFQVVLQNILVIKATV